MRGGITELLQSAAYTVKRRVGYLEEPDQQLHAPTPPGLLLLEVFIREKLTDTMYQRRL